MRIKYFDKTLPVIAPHGGDWIDLYSRKEMLIHAGQTVKIPLNVAVELPAGFEAWIAPRSSLLGKTGLVVPLGIVDEAYCGDGDEWHLIAYASRDCKIERGQRIAQTRLMPHMQLVTLETVDELGNPDRGGMGSTGD